MQYTVSLEIDKPRDEVAAEVEEEELLEGEEGKPGAKTKLIFLWGKRRMENVETITVREPPELFETTYDAKGVHNIVRIRLTELGPEKTRLDAENEFVFSGFMKVMAFLMKGAFPKQTRQIMNDFKALAETGTDVRDAGK